MNRDTTLIAAAGFFGQAILLGVVIAQNRSMKKNNAEAAKAVESVGELQGMLNNAIDSTVTILSNDELDFDGKLKAMHEQFSFVHHVVNTRLEEFDEEEK
jgi:hypothetical protein